MADWTYWLIGAGLLIVAELFIGTFYLLMIALGLVAGALAAWVGASGAFTKQECAGLTSPPASARSRPPSQD